MGEYTGGGNRDGFAGGIGRLTDGRVISDREGNLTDARTGEAVAPPGAPAKDGGRPQFSREDLEHIDSSASEIDAELDTEQAAREAQMRKLGFTDAEIARQRGEAGESVTKAPQVTRASLETQLAELKALKASDPKRYWGAEAQAHELEIIRQLEGAKSSKVETKAAKAEAPAEAEAETAEPDGLAAIEAELAKIAAARKADRRSYDKDEALQARERELIAALEEAKHEASAIAQGQAVVKSILDEAPDAEALDASFMQVFSEMPEEAQDAIRIAIATPADPVRMASEADIELFASIPVQAEAVKEWGRQAPKRLAILRERVVPILEANPALGHWFDGLPPEQAKAILRQLSR